MGPVFPDDYRPTDADLAIAPAALVVASLAVGESLVTGAGDGPVLQATARALRAFGADVARDGRNWRVRGIGIGGLAEPGSVIDLHGAAMALPLILGLAATHPLTCFLTGDAGPSLLRLVEPLQRQGARFLLRGDHALPLGLAGARHPVPQEHRLTVPAAAIKAAILLAGLNTPGITRVIEPAGAPPSIETLLAQFGADIRHAVIDGAAVTDLVGQPELAPRRIAVDVA